MPPWGARCWRRTWKRSAPFMDARGPIAAAFFAIPQAIWIWLTVSSMSRGPRFGDVLGAGPFCFLPRWISRRRSRRGSVRRLTATSQKTVHRRPDAKGYQPYIGRISAREALGVPLRHSNHRHSHDRSAMEARAKKGERYETRDLARVGASIDLDETRMSSLHFD